MGRHTDRKPRRDRDDKMSRSSGKSRSGSDRKSFKNNTNGRDRERLSNFQWHNYSRDADTSSHASSHTRERTPAKVSSSGKLRVEREDGTAYEIHKDLLKYTKAGPCIAYSHRPAESPRPLPPPAKEGKAPQTVEKTPERLLEQLEKTSTKPVDQAKKESKKADKKDVPPEKGKVTLPEPVEPKTPVQEQQQPPKRDSPSPATNRNSIKINLAELLPPEAKEEGEEEDDSGPIYDMFGENPEPEPVKKRFHAQSKKLEIPKSSLQLISSLYDEEDEEDMVPTNSLCIGSNQIKPRKVKKEKKERNKEPEPLIATPLPLTPVVVEAEAKVDVKPEPETAPIVVVVKEEPPPSPKPSPPPLLIPVRPQPMQEMKALDLLKTLESESTEVDDFLQQIQQQRQLIEEKLSGAASSRKPPPPPATKFLIDIDSVQREINDKLEELPEIDDYAELPTIPLNLDFKKTSFPISKSPLQKMPDDSSSSSSSSEDSSNSSSSDEGDSDSDTSGSSSDTSSTSQSSESSSNGSDQEKDEMNLETTPVKLNLAVDLTLASRSPVMLKIQPKPRVIPVLTALGDEEQQKPSATVAKRSSSSSTSTARRKSTSDPKERKDRHEKSKRRESRRDEKTERPKNRGFSYERSSSSRKHSSRESASGPRERSHRERVTKERSSRKAERDTKKEKDRGRRPKSIERTSWRRSRSKSKSPPPPRPSRPIDRRMESRSRSRSLSVDREEHGRKRSPWRPPIDFWENLNVPTNSWAYNDEQYFSRAYYDESYNYFEQNQINQQCGGGGDGYGDGGHGAHQSWQPPQNREMTNGGSSSPMRDSLDDRINHVLNGGIQQQQQQQPPPQHHLQEDPYTCYDNNSSYNEYNRPPHNSHPPSYYNQQPPQQQQHQYDNRGPGGSGDHYRQSANLLSINCSDAPRQTPPAPFALQKGNVIELVPSQLDSNQSSSGYHSEEQQNNEGVRTRTTSSTHRKHIREKKRMEKNMRKKKLELELQQLLEGSSGIEINIEGERKPSPSREEVRKVIFSDGVLPGDGTSDSVLDSSEDSNTDLAELTSNQLKKYRKKKRKKRSTEKSNANKPPEISPPMPVVEVDLPAVNGDAAVEEEALCLPLPPPPPNDPPVNLVQPSLKREVMERPKKLLYFNTCHRERRMDFFSIFVPFSMFIRLNDPRLLQGHPMIVNRRRIPQPIYPPNVYPPPPQPFQHLPPVQISGAMPCEMQNTMPQVMQVQGPISVPTPTGPIRHIPTIGDN